MKKIFIFVLLLVVSFGFKIGDVNAFGGCSSGTARLTVRTPTGNPPTSYPVDVTISWSTDCYGNQVVVYGLNSPYPVAQDSSGSVTHTATGPETYTLAAFDGPPSGPEGICPLATRESCSLTDAMWSKTAYLLDAPAAPVVLSGFKVNGQTSIVAYPNTNLSFSAVVPSGVVGCDLNHFVGGNFVGSLGGLAIGAVGTSIDFSSKNGTAGSILGSSYGGNNFELTCASGDGMYIVRPQVYVDYNPAIISTPSSPSGLSVSPSTCGNNWLNLSWNVSPAATSYQVYRDGSVISLSYVCDAISCVVSDTGLVLGSTHSYTVTASNAGGASAKSSSVSNTVASACPPPSTCNVSTDTNYGLVGACAGTCKNGYTNYPTCTYVPPPPPPVPVISSFTANPTAGQVGIVNPGLSWTVTNSPTSCTAIGDWSGSKPTSGNNVLQGVLNSVKTYTFTLTCSNGGGASAPKSVTVIVTAAPPTTATITVNSNVSTGWCVNGGNCVSNSTTKTYTVTPGAGGSSYTLTANDLSPTYTGPSITNDVTGSGSTLSLFVGETGTFTVSYTPVAGDPGCQGCTGGFNYDLTNTGVGNPAPGQVTINKILKGGTPQSVFLSVSSGIPGLKSSISGQSCILGCSSVISFIVPSSTPDGTYTITVTGDPGAKTTTFPLIVSGGGGGNLLSVTSCKANPLTQAWIGQKVTWSVLYSGGTPPYQFRWTGPGMKNDSAWLSADTYELTYSTTGKKSASVEVKDSAGSLKSVDCDVSSIQIKVNPAFKEQ